MLAHKDTILWIDDVPVDFSNSVGQAVLESEKTEVIKILNIYESDHTTQGKRSWIEAQYVF